MTHKAISAECESLGLTVEQKSDAHAFYYIARPSTPGSTVLWRTSREGGVLGLPRVISKGRDTHARTLKEIRYLVKG